MKIVNQFLEMPPFDDEDVRRRHILEILLSILGILLFLILFSLIVLTILSNDHYLEPIKLTVGMLIGTILIYAINRYLSWPAWISSTLFLVFLLGAFIFIDAPLELATGLSVLLFTLPIIIASVTLKPYASFLFALFSSIEISILALLAKQVPNPLTILVFFMIALTSWLIARYHENALQNVREININLDRIVQQRTQSLVNALTREQIEARHNQIILESIADGVIVFNSHGKAIKANPALEKLIEIPNSDLLNIPLNDFVEISPMDAKNKETLLTLLSSPGKKQPNQRVSWGRKTISISSGQVQDRDGSVVGTVAVFRDITKEAELEKMKSEFVAIVSHELRTPLSSIIGYAEIVKEKVYGPLNQKQIYTIDRIIKNSRRLINLINNLLDQAQIEAGKLKIHHEPIKLSQLLENLHYVMDKHAEDKDLKLTSTLDENLQPEILGDEARLQQILVNLVTNAVKFTDTGTIHVDFYNAGNDKWGITVSDSGQGIPEVELPHIFESFRQVEGATTRIHGGFGLGLSIVKQLVQLMCGEISVKSELGTGSTFIITLPVNASVNGKE